MAPNPRTQAHRSYYKYKFGLEAKRILLPLVHLSDEELHKIEITFDARQRRMSTRAIQQRLMYGLQYLIDTSDPDGKFATLRDKLRIMRTGNKVIIYAPQDLSHIARYTDFAGAMAQEDAEEPTTAADSWRTQLVTFVDESLDGERFTYDKHLTKDDLLWLGEYLMPLTNRICIEKLGPTGLRLWINPVLAPRHNSAWLK